MKKTYIGDSVYAEWNGVEIILTTENGYPDDPRNRIVMGPSEWSCLLTFLKASQRSAPPDIGKFTPHLCPTCKEEHLKTAWDEKQELKYLVCQNCGHEDNL